MIEEFGERLKAFLKARRMTLAVCAQKTGISKNTLEEAIRRISMLQVDNVIVLPCKINKFKESGKVLTIHEPTCGSGGMILAALDVLWNTYQFNYCENAFIFCGDIDTRCVYMAYIQLSLAGVPAAIRHQNGLTLETWDEWHTPALKMQYLKFRKYLNLR